MITSAAKAMVVKILLVTVEVAASAIFITRSVNLEPL
jgi:hypothetical protein